MTGSGSAADGAPSMRWFPPGASAKVGMARADITPPVGIRAHNWGAGHTERSTGIHVPLTATALAMVGADETAFLVSLDLGWFTAPAHDAAIRGQVLAALDLPEDRLLLHLIHTHAGPTTSPDEEGLPGGDLIPAYIDQLISTVADICRQAENAAVECDISWGYGHCDLAVVRDLPCGARDVVGFNPDVPADDTVAIGRITDPDGATVGVLLNYACHPTSLAWDNSLLSPDYVGEARRTVEQETGAPCLFLQGASGELSPREQYSGDPAVADRNGRMLGLAALAALAAMPPPGAVMHLDEVVESGAPLAIWRYHPDSRATVLQRRRIDVPVGLKPERTAEEIMGLWPGIDPAAAQERARRAERGRAAYAGLATAQHPVWIWLCGDAVLVAHPGEAFSLLQTELRRRHPDRTIFVLNLTNGPGYFYLPSAEAYSHDRYQVWQTQYRQGALETVIDAVDRVLSGLPSGHTPKGPDRVGPPGNGGANAPVDRLVPVEGPA